MTATTRPVPQSERKAQSPTFCPNCGAQSVISEWEDGVVIRVCYLCSLVVPPKAAQSGREAE